MFGFLFRKRAGFRLPTGEYCDPLRAYRILLAGNINGILDRCRSPFPDKYVKAEEEACDLARQAFGLEEFDPRTGCGCTDEEATQALESFMEFLSKKGWAAKPSLTSSPPMDSLDDSPQTTS